jgi:hypothetical protein
VGRSYSRAGASRQLARDATAIARGGDDVLIAAGGQALAIAPAATPRVLGPVTPGATAILRAGGALVTGYASGRIEINVAAANVVIEGASASRVRALAAGPADTFAAGFQEGTAAVYALRGGEQLAKLRLRGPVTGLSFDGGRLFAVSATGYTDSVDLGALGSGYCDLVREVWKSSPMIWRGGAPVAREPPPDHACARR